MATNKVVSKRKQIIAYVISETGLTKKKKIRDYIMSHGNYSKHFKGLSVRSFNETIAFDPDQDVLDKGHYIKGRTIHKNSKGEIMSEWVKTDTQKALLEEQLKEVMKGLSEDITPYKPIQLLQMDRSSKLVNQYTITDYHLGMFSWAAETGTEWSSKIAEETIVKWFEVAIQNAPKAKTAIFAQIGDFLHFDGLDPVTPQSKHVLDADVKYQQLIRMAMKVIRRIINMLLAKYEEVKLIQVEGNHDMASSAWLKETFSMFYEDNPRMYVDTNPTPYHCYTQGKLCLFYAHTHTKKMGAIDSVFVGMYKKQYGESEHVYAHTGHLHHMLKLESNLMILEQHATLASKDSYAVRHGYLSKRSATVITYHEDYGEVGRSTLTPEMLK